MAAGLRGKGRGHGGGVVVVGGGGGGGLGGACGEGGSMM